MAASSSALASLPSYKYSPLKVRESIRVLSIQPAALRESPLRCSLAEVPLQPVPRYAALSYAWDVPTPSRPIECDGQRLLITRNCEAALYQLRREQDVRVLWVDSICIDQSSVTEKNHQVALMGEIYKQGEQVIAWLGESDPRMDDALQKLQAIGQASVENKDQAKTAFHLVFGLDVRNEAQDPLGIVFERAWFYRLWTVQEVTLPQVWNVGLYCGSFSFPWIYLLMAVSYLRTAKYRWGRWDEATRLQRRLTGMLMKDENSAFWRNFFDDSLKGTDWESSMLALLMNMREKETTKPEDKIFALFAVMKELGFHLPVPDYGKSLAQIYTETTVACVEHDKSLNVLLEVPSENRRPGLPSWVPDWSDQGWGIKDKRKEVLELDFQAGGSGHPQWSFSTDLQQLVAAGKVVDSIHECGHPLKLEGDFDKDFMNLIPGSHGVSLKEALRRIHPAFDIFRNWVGISLRHNGYPSEDDRISALQRVLQEGGGGQSPGNSASVDFAAWYSVMQHQDLTWLSELIAKTALGPVQSNEASSVSDTVKKAKLENLPAEWQSWLAISTGPVSASAFHLALVRSARNKSFIVTGRGMFGMSATETQKGDPVVVLAGLRLPVILRRVGASFRVIGHAYVDGLMNGEAWTGDVEDIVLE